MLEPKEKPRKFHNVAKFCRLQKFCKLRIFERCENFAGCKFSQLGKISQDTNFRNLLAALPFCFSHNFLIRSSFYLILVPFESLESLESKSSQK